MATLRFIELPEASPTKDQGVLTTHYCKVRFKTQEIFSNPDGTPRPHPALQYDKRDLYKHNGTENITDPGYGLTMFFCTPNEAKQTT